MISVWRLEHSSVSYVYPATGWLNAGWESRLSYAWKPTQRHQLALRTASATATATATAKCQLPDYEQPQVSFRHAELCQRYLGFGNKFVELTSRIRNRPRKS